MEKNTDDENKANTNSLEFLQNNLFLPYVLPALYNIYQQKQGYNELKFLLGILGPCDAFTKALQYLEDKGFVKKVTVHSVQKKADYWITELGITFVKNHLLDFITISNEMKANKNNFRKGK